MGACPGARQGLNLVQSSAEPATHNGGVSAQVTMKDFSCTLGDCNPITPGLQSKFAGVNLKSELDSPGVSAPQAFCPVRSQSDQRISLLAGVPY